MAVAVAVAELADAGPSMPSMSRVGRRRLGRRLPGYLGTLTAGIGELWRKGAQALLGCRGTGTGRSRLAPSQKFDICARGMTGAQRARTGLAAADLTSRLPHPSASASPRPPASNPPCLRRTPLSGTRPSCRTRSPPESTQYAIAPTPAAQSPQIANTLQLIDNDPYAAHPPLAACLRLPTCFCPPAHTY